MLEGTNLGVESSSFEFLSPFQLSESLLTTKHDTLVLVVAGLHGVQGSGQGGGAGWFVRHQASTDGHQVPDRRLSQLAARFAKPKLRRAVHDARHDQLEHAHLLGSQRDQRQSKRESIKSPTSSITPGR